MHGIFKSAPNSAANLVELTGMQGSSKGDQFGRLHRKRVYVCVWDKRLQNVLHHCSCNFVFYCLHLHLFSRLRLELPCKCGYPEASLTRNMKQVWAQVWAQHYSTNSLRRGAIFLQCKWTSAICFWCFFDVLCSTQVETHVLRKLACDSSKPHWNFAYPSPICERFVTLCWNPPFLNCETLDHTFLCNLVTSIPLLTLVVTCRVLGTKEYNLNGFPPFTISWSTHESTSLVVAWAARHKLHTENVQGRAKTAMGMLGGMSLSNV